MATSTTTKSRPVRSLVTFAILALALPLGLLGLGIANDARTPANPSGANWLPMLGLDLGGGNEFLIRPVDAAASDAESVDQLPGVSMTADQLAAAAGTIRDRLNAFGAEATVYSRGTEGVVVDLADSISWNHVSLMTSRGVAEVRPVLLTGSGWIEEAATDPAAADGASDGTADETAAGDAANDEPAPEETPVDPGLRTGPGNAEDPWSLEQITPEMQAFYDQLDCTTGTFANAPVPATDAMVTCSSDGWSKFILGPVVVAADGFDRARIQTGQRQDGSEAILVSVNFDDKGTTQFADATAKAAEFGGTEGDPRNQLAMSVDNLVLTAPTATEEITSGSIVIDASLTAESAAVLAAQINSGALPETFQIQSGQPVSGTLSPSLRTGALITSIVAALALLAFGLWRYRGLALVALAALLAVSALTYLAFNLLSWSNDVAFVLTMAGLAGAGLGAMLSVDSSMRLFRGVADEQTAGRPAAVAVDRGWTRARRGIVLTALITVLASVALYYAGTGGVKAFAFALGFVAAFDLLVSACFTKPLVALVAGKPFFRPAAATTVTEEGR